MHVKSHTPAPEATHTICYHLLPLQAEEAAPAEVQAALQELHQWSSTVDISNLLQLMADNDRAAVQALHDKASRLVQQLEQQLQQQQVTEQVAATWLKASAYDTYALQARTSDWLSGLTDNAAAARLAELVRVRGAGLEPVLSVLVFVT